VIVVGSIQAVIATAAGTNCTLTATTISPTASAFPGIREEKSRYRPTMFRM
jgi:hypothetical protein